MTFLRGALAVFGGFAAMTLAVMLGTIVAGSLLLGGAGPEVEPTAPYLVVNLGWSAVAAVLGGYMAAALSPRQPLLHALALAGLVLAFGLGSLLLLEPGAVGGQPTWYAETALVIGLVGVVLGGAVRARRSTRGGG